MRLANLAGLGVALLVLLVLSLPVVPSAGLRQGKYMYNPPPLQDHIAGVSQSAYLSYYLQHPEQASAELRPAISALLAQGSDSGEQPLAGNANDIVLAQGRFNKEDGTLPRSMPQNEESVTFCGSNTNEVLMGTNDYRGIFSGGNLTGWHFSTNGSSVLNEGLLESVNPGSGDLPSRGDPVMRSRPATSGCNYYAASIAVNADGSNLPSAIAIYATNSASLTNCAPCWQQKLTVVNSGTDFLDKAWMDVGSDGASGSVLWVAWTRFQNYGGAGGHSPVEAARCVIQGGSGLISSCTAPIPLSAVTAEGQYPYVTMAPNGRTYITWIEVASSAGGDVFTIYMRVAEPGATTFGNPMVVYQEQHPLGFATSLSQNDFRVSSIPSATALDLGGGTNRVYIAWAFCQQLVRVSVVDTCRDSDLKITHADDGQPFGTPLTLTAAGSQYFPSIDADNTGQRLYLTYYSNEADPWNHRQQVILASSPPDLSGFTSTALNAAYPPGDLNCDHFVGVIDMILGLQAIAGNIPPLGGCPVDLNEPDADPYLGGLFIGDYMEVAAENGLAYVGYTANFTKLNFLGTGPPTYQQDNYLAKFIFP